MRFKQTNPDEKTQIRKMDAAYIGSHPVHCFLVYFCLCFAFIRIVLDILGEPCDLFGVYILSFLFSSLFLLAMRIWARRICD